MWYCLSVEQRGITHFVKALFIKIQKDDQKISGWSLSQIHMASRPVGGPLVLGDERTDWGMVIEVRSGQVN